MKSVVKTLREYFSDKNINSVYLAGSILKEGFFYDFSDIDIVVEELREDYFRTLCELEEIFPYRVDLIELEKCLFREQILRKSLKII